jgi:four helix bundle protein
VSREAVGRKDARRFEDLIAWRKARELTADVYRMTREGEFARDWGLAGQIQRAAVSVMSNIAEGYERGSRNEYCHFLSVAKASCGEVRSQLYVAYDVGYIPESTFKEILLRAEEVSRVLSGLRASLQPDRPTR